MQTIQEKIKQRRKQILVNSCIYYKFNENLVSDHDFDRWCKELHELQSEHPEDSEAVKDHYEIFKDWDGQTANCHALPITEPWIIHKAKIFLWYNKNNIVGNECKIS